MSFLEPHVHLAIVNKDYHAKRDAAYILIDRNRSMVVLSQSLPLLVEWMNETLVDAREGWDKVTVAGISLCVNQTDGRTAGWHKRRWRIRHVPLAQAVDEFETARAGCDQAVVISGMWGSYMVRVVSTRT